MRNALGLLGVTVAVLVLAQIFLPGIAARKVRERVARYGVVESASVKAFPAIELLWEKADSAKVKVRSLKASAVQTAELLSSTRGVHDLRIQVATLHEGPITLHDAEIHKLGNQLEAKAQLSQSDLQAALPPELEVQPLSSADGKVQVRAGGGLLGVHASVPATVEADEGKLVAQPEGLPLAGFTRLTLFADPRIAVQGVAMSAAGTGTGAGAASGSTTSEGSLAGASSYQVRIRLRLR
jgi:hypothetical protein